MGSAVVEFGFRDPRGVLRGGFSGSGVLMVLFSVVLFSVGCWPGFKW